MERSIRKAVIYTRVASGTEAERAAGHRMQKRRCVEHARTRGYPVAVTFRDDGSGNVAARPSIKSLLKFLEDDQQYVVLVEDVSRISRDMSICMQLLLRIKQSGALVEMVGLKQFIPANTHMKRARARAEA